LITDQTRDNGFFFKDAEYLPVILRRTEPFRGNDMTSDIDTGLNGGL